MHILRLLCTLPGVKLFSLTREYVLRATFRACGARQSNRLLLLLLLGIIYYDAYPGVLLCRRKEIYAEICAFMQRMQNT